jgi:hypothetical protein
MGEKKKKIDKTSFTMPFTGALWNMRGPFIYLRFLHYCDIKKAPDSADDSYDWLLKMRTIFDKLSDVKV